MPPGTGLPLIRHPEEEEKQERHAIPLAVRSPSDGMLAEVRREAAIGRLHLVPSVISITMMDV